VDGVEVCTPRPVVAADGTWKCTPTTPIADGPHTLTVTQTDPAGNVSPVTTVPFSVDTVPPIVPACVPSQNPALGVVPVVITCTAGEPGTTISIPGTNCVPPIIAADGKSVCTATTPTSVPQNPVVTVTDPAGNNSTGIIPLSICTANDCDGDGVPNDIEDKGPNGGDSNGDGIKDSIQPNVTTVETSKGFATLVASGECSLLQKVKVVQESSLPKQDDEYDYPFGLISFQSPCAKSITIKTHWFGMADNAPYTFRKELNSNYMNMDDLKIEKVKLYGNDVIVTTMTVKDNDKYDADATVGLIRDPFGPAIKVVKPIVKVAELVKTGSSTIPTMLVILIALSAMVYTVNLKRA
jgi:Bacterial Ig-like domain